MEPDTIYLVAATAGDYSDREEWTVCAYGDMEQATFHVNALNEAFRTVVVGA